MKDCHSLASLPSKWHLSRLFSPGLWFLHMGACPHRGVMSRDEGEGLTPTAFLCLRLTVLYCQGAWLPGSRAPMGGSTLHTSANSALPTRLNPCTITLEISQVTINTTISFPLHLGALCVVCTSITKNGGHISRGIGDFPGVQRKPES